MAPNWKTVPIREAYHGMYDGPHATPKPSDSGPIFLGIKNVGESGQLDLSDVRHISEDDYPRWTRRVEPRPGDIVFSYEATLNRYATIPRGFRGCLGRRMALIRPDESKVSGRFLFYYFFGREWREVIATNTLIGSTVDRIPIAKFPDFPIKLPPLASQHKIAAILSAYNDLMENNLRRIKILEEMAQNLYREWFVRFRFPGHQHARLVDSPLGPIPEGWEFVPLDNLVSLSRKGVQPRNAPEEIFEHFSFPAYDSGKLPFVECGASIKSGKYEVPPNCVLVPKLNPHIPRTWSPNPSGGLRAIASTEYLILQPKRYSTAFFYTFFTDPQIVERLAGRADGTSTSHKRIKPGDFLSQLMIAPPDAIADAFDSVAVPSMGLVNALIQKNRALRRTRDLLLPKLISGELDVSELDIVTEQEAA